MKMRLLDIQPSQLYISEAKLRDVESWLNRDTASSYAALQVKQLNGRGILTDGHTRALTLHRLGFETVRVEWDTDDLDWEAYQICVDWCVSEGISNVTHLANRIISAEDYERLWHDRCRQMQAELKEKRQREGQ